MPLEIFFYFKIKHATLKVLNLYKFIVLYLIILNMMMSRLTSFISTSQGNINDIHREKLYFTPFSTRTY